MKPHIPGVLRWDETTSEWSSSETESATWPTCCTKRIQALHGIPLLCKDCQCTEHQLSANHVKFFIKSTDTNLWYIYSSWLGNTYVCIVPLMWYDIVSLFGWVSAETSAPTCCFSSYGWSKCPSSVGWCGSGGAGRWFQAPSWFHRPAQRELITRSIIKWINIDKYKQVSLYFCWSFFQPFLYIFENV